jgi:hypothetical protein
MAVLRFSPSSNLDVAAVNVKFDAVDEGTVVRGKEHTASAI